MQKELKVGISIFRLDSICLDLQIALSLFHTSLSLTHLKKTSKTTKKSTTSNALTSERILVLEAELSSKIEENEILHYQKFEVEHELKHQIEVCNLNTQKEAELNAKLEDTQIQLQASREKLKSQLNETNTLIFQLWTKLEMTITDIILSLKLLRKLEKMQRSGNGDGLSLPLQTAAVIDSFFKLIGISDSDHPLSILCKLNADDVIKASSSYLNIGELPLVNSQRKLLQNIISSASKLWPPSPTSSSSSTEWGWNMLTLEKHIYAYYHCCLIRKLLFANNETEAQNILETDRGLAAFKNHSKDWPFHLLLKIRFLWYRRPRKEIMHVADGITGNFASHLDAVKNLVVSSRDFKSRELGILTELPLQRDQCSVAERLAEDLRRKQEELVNSLKEKNLQID